VHRQLRPVFEHDDDDLEEIPGTVRPEPQHSLLITWSIQLFARDRVLDRVANVVVGHAVLARGFADLHTAPIVLRNGRVEKRALNLSRLSIALGQEVRVDVELRAGSCVAKAGGDGADIDTGANETRRGTVAGCVLEAGTAGL
jgi:hypothetical protein